jgi:hypothetical protein
VVPLRLNGAVLRGPESWPRLSTSLLLLFAVVPFFRYLLGMHRLDTDGCLLAFGIQHGS